MKKTLILGITLFIITTSCQAQAALFALLFGDKVATENFNVSLEAGGTFMGYTNLDDSGRSKMGINFGIGGNIKLNENWFVCPNIYFLAKRNLFLNNFSLDSGNANLDSDFSNVPTRVTLDYIDVPIFFSYQTNNKKYRFSLAPQVSFLQKSRGEFQRPEGDFTQNFDGYTKDVDYGMMVDFAYILGKAHKGKGLHIHLRYYYGFTDILNDQISTADNRSNYLSLHLSLPFITNELAEKNLESYSE
ncbi:porin family protein [Tamlana sp. 2_MG-2023]|uniref:porin family protein n=1 Tax=unclassified Tamlana TaxID=2614803 RepID=UPI0026E40F7E|nr:MULTISPECIES: porin family protein [unclassified Tamlana]MDO6761389.1 porin family protein [Tamlana sp. 2_MG-2023]MDO6791997.1 porin family protein [Tamlana sp. 1_MG-2023]